jgi:hypothetical protein
VKKSNQKSTFKEKFAIWKYKLRFFKNKYIFTLTGFVIFALFLDDNDIFTLMSQNRKLSKIQLDHKIIQIKLKETRYTLKQLSHGAALEKYAREEKLFKKDDEDIFILTFE